MELSIVPVDIIDRGEDKTRLAAVYILQGIPSTRSAPQRSWTL